MSAPVQSQRQQSTTSQHSIKSALKWISQKMEVDQEKERARYEGIVPSPWQTSANYKSSASRNASVVKSDAASSIAPVSGRSSYEGLMPSPYETAAAHKERMASKVNGKHYW